MENLSLSKEEHEYMARFPFFDEEYLDYLDNFRFKPSEQVVTHFDETTEDFELEVKGLWDETILYEVPLLALISEAYFRFTDKDWSHDGQAEKTKIKTRALIEHGCIFSEFGTRRRRDFLTHDLVVKSIVEANNSYKLECEEKGAEPKGICGGTSNVYLAQKYNVNAIGTVGKYRNSAAIV
jgi:nicotinate phosphoribosyltransferase